MAGMALQSNPMFWRVPVRYLGIYLIYLAAFVRIFYEYEESPYRGLAVVLLVIYGSLLLVEPWLTRSRGWRSWAYLLTQAALVIGLQLLPSNAEIIAALFVPLSLQAVLLFSRRAGFFWIAAFTLVCIEPVVSAWGWTPAGAAMALLYGGIFSLMGYFAYLIRTAEAAHQNNQRIIGELRVTHQRLQDYASEMEESATVQERSRLARELHDSVTQTIFSMTLTVQTARALLDRDPDRVPAQLGRLQELARGASGEIQLLVNQLRPRPVADEGLPARLRRLITEGEARDGLQIRLEISGERDLAGPVVAGLCRIAQEALNNVAKHAQTREAVVRLDLAAERPWLEVEDRGIGFDPVLALSDSGHLGLVGMAERARELGWKISYDSHFGRGTRVRAEEV
jgi:signal transduction histidine kinase